MRTTVFPSRPAFVVDPDSITRSQGRQIDWLNVSDLYRDGSQRVVVDTGGAGAGTTSVPIAELMYVVPKNVMLKFGEYAPVVVTVGVAGAAADATAIPCAALSGPIPSGSLLDFGGKKFARTTALAPAGAVSIPCSALPTALVSGDAATFKGGTKQARVTTAANIGATALVVDELQFALMEGDVAITGGTGNKRLPAGKIMAQLDSGLTCPRESVPGDETAQYMLETNAQENSVTDSKSGYGHMTGGHFFENLLPDADEDGNLPSGWITELRAHGGSWLFEQYADTR